MTNNQNQPTPNMVFTNEIINMANAGLQEGKDVEELAKGTHHAAANFSAFAFFRSKQSAVDPNESIEDFVKFFEYYLNQHAPKEDDNNGLFDTIAKTKDEL